MTKLEESIYFVSRVFTNGTKKKIDCVYKLTNRVILDHIWGTPEIEKLIRKEMKRSIMETLIENVLGYISEKTLGQGDYKVYVSTAVKENERILIVHPEEYVKMLRRG